MIWIASSSSLLFLRFFHIYFFLCHFFYSEKPNKNIRQNNIIYLLCYVNFYQPDIAFIELTSVQIF